MLPFFLIFMFHLLFSCSSEVVKPIVIDKPRPTISTNYFRSPVNHDIKLAGTFCELRPNHFHTGIDIKSAAGVVGDDIFAVADGYVARIGASPQGYGYSLYIAHPNGYTSVYGHLLSFDKNIADYLLKQQLIQQRFDVQLYPDSLLLPVKKGQIIAKMGNTGSSKGAHLHFEIRETVSELPVNPLLFGIKVSDNQAPGISYARIYDLDQGFNEFNAKNLIAKKKGEIFVPSTGDTIKTFSTLVGLGINTRDGQIGNWNKNGVYEIKMWINDTLAYHVRMDSVSFDQTRMINAHLDYPEQRNKKNYVHKCYSVPGNKLRIIKNKQNRGVLKLFIDQPKRVKFEVKDFNMNTAVMKFIVLRKSGDPKFKLPYYNYKLPFDKPSILRDTGIEVLFTERTFFKDQELNFNSNADRSSKIYSNVYNIGEANVPVFDYYKVKIRENGVPAHLKSKAFIASCDERNQESNWGGSWEGNWMTGNIRSYGSFYISIDTIKPTAIPIIFNANMTKTSKIVFKIDDNITPAGQTEMLNYKAYIDDELIIMVYDLKTKTITYVFPSSLSKGSHTFKLEVFDALKNTNTRELKFNR